MKLRAVFTGKKGSMGFFTGSEYTLIIKKNVLATADGRLSCAYTLEGFFANWRIIEVLGYGNNL